MIIKGDCIQEMKLLDENSVDAIVTDPPYGLEFMGKEWDRLKKINTGGGIKGELSGTGIKRNTVNYVAGSEAQEFHNQWATECLRVIKPGGFLLSFGGTRTYHRLVCGIEDAGFEIRDTIMWLYGSGFPKSLNIGKQIDKQPNTDINFKKWLKKYVEKSSKTIRQLINECGFDFTHYYRIDIKKQETYPSEEKYNVLKNVLFLPDDYDYIVKNNCKERGYKENNFRGESSNKILKISGNSLKDNPISPEAKEWEGWGTALKPAVEPIVVTRKPLSEKNVALNVLKWGTGGINIDACRIGTEIRTYKAGLTNNERLNDDGWDKIGNPNIEVSAQGRFPANIILDEEAGKLMPDDEEEYIDDSTQQQTLSGGIHSNRVENKSASRFFYCAKASKSERNFGCEDLEAKQRDEGRKEGNPGGDNPRNRGVQLRTNNHPTVKPIKLMEYLIELVSREGATVLDPFLGSGTTAIACVKLNRKFIGIEKEEEYIKIAKARIKPFLEQNKLEIK